MFRRNDVKQEIFVEHLHATAACISEMENYRCTLGSSPNSVAAFLAQTPDVAFKAAHSRLLDDLRREWQMVIRLEAKACTQKLLADLCPHTLWQPYRELFSTLEMAAFQLSEDFLGLVQAYFLLLTQSANIEDVYSAMQDSVKRGTKAEKASASNLSAVAVRSLSQRLCNGEQKPTAVTLNDQDFVGREVRCLKTKLWTPDAFVPRTLEAAVYY